MLQRGELSQAKKAYDRFNKKWLQIEEGIKEESSTAYRDIESNMGKVGYVFSLKNRDQILQSLQGLQDVNEKFINGGYPKEPGFTQGEGKGKGWIWSGVLAGVGVSVILAIIVKFAISSGAFGNNNLLIAGWTGVLAAAMLLYMSYWLHSQSNIANWNQYIREKSQTALSTGKMISLGLLAFLAVFREGTETVLFYIGMVSSIKLQSLLLGFLIGVLILVVLAYLMITVGLKLPLRPFFMVSSVIVFYLCIKFMGMGIHSLQLAGVIQTTNASMIPSIEFFALYPSWESSIPQMILILMAIFIILFKNKKSKKLITTNNN